MAVHWRRVESSNLESVGWDGNGNLYVRFKETKYSRARTYWYKGVPESVYQGLLAAPSKGKYFHANVRDRYDTLQIR